MKSALWVFLKTNEGKYTGIFLDTCYKHDNGDLTGHYRVHNQ